MILVDASVLANAFTDDGPVGSRSREELGRDTHWAAPEHLLVETFSAVRSRYLGHKISEARAAAALDALRMAAIERVSTLPLLGRMEELRDSVNGHDAAYVAAAEIY